MLTLILGLGNIGKKYQQTRHNLGFEVVDRVVEKLGAVRQDDSELYEWWKVEVEGEEGLLRRVEDAASRNDDPLSTQPDGQTGTSAAHGERSRRPEAGLAMTGSAEGGATDSDRGTHSKLWGTKEEDEEGLLRSPATRSDTHNDVPGGPVEDGQTGASAAHQPGGWTEGLRRSRSIYLAKPTTYMNGSGEAAKELIERLKITPAEILIIVDDFQIPLGAIRFRPNGSDGGHNGLMSVIEELGTQAFPRLRLGIGAPIDKAQVVDYVLSRFAKSEKPLVEKMLAVAAEGVIFALQHRLEVVMSKYNCNPAPPDLA